jgi:predicted acetyltransferase
MLWRGWQREVAAVPRAQPANTASKAVKQVVKQVLRRGWQRVVAVVTTKAQPDNTASKAVIQVVKQVLC